MGRTYLRPPFYAYLKHCKWDSWLSKVKHLQLQTDANYVQKVQPKTGQWYPNMVQNCNPILIQIVVVIKDINPNIITVQQHCSIVSDVSEWWQWQWQWHPYFITVPTTQYTGCSANTIMSSSWCMCSAILLTCAIDWHFPGSTWKLHILFYVLCLRHMRACYLSLCHILSLSSLLSVCLQLCYVNLYITWIWINEY